jgi:soluble lytic murein transglycosylase-like protein
VAGASIPEIVEAAAKKHDVDPLLVHSVISTESNYNPYAVSPKGAQGLMQLMPATARRFGVRNSFDIKENIEGGVRYLKYLGSLFPNDPRLAIAAYNAGEGAVWKYGNNIPPYRETEQYVQRVGMKYGKARKEAERKKSEAPLQTAQATITTAEARPQPVHVYVDAEGRLYLRNTPPPSESATP